MSSYVYGNPQYLPINEKHPLNPLIHMQKAKLWEKIFVNHITMILI